MATGRFSLPSLAAKMGVRGVAGFHDMRRVVIAPADTGGHLVARHEAIHDEFLHNTGFGLMQLVFRRVASEASAAAIQSRAALWLEYLVAESISTHECAATYLSIKDSAAQLEAEIVEGHPPEYQGYFRRIAEVVDTVFRSSFIQYIVGKILVEIALNSEAVVALTPWNADREPEMEKILLPDHRLGLLLDRAPGLLPELLALLGETAARALQDLPHDGRPFDIQDETCWLGLRADVLDGLNALLVRATRRWFYAAVAPACPSLDLTAFIPTCERFIAAVAAATGVEMPVGGSRSTEFSAAPEAWRLGTAVIANHMVANAVRPETLSDEANVSEVIGPAKGDIVLISERVDGGEVSKVVWRRFLTHAPRAIEASRFSHAVLRKVLLARRIRMQISGITTKLEALVAGPFLNVEAFSAIYNEILPFYNVGTPSNPGLFETDRLFWYMGGNVFEWCSWLKQGERLEAGLLEYGGRKPESVEAIRQWTVGDAEARLSTSGNDIAVLVLRQPRIAGLFFRVFTEGVFTNLASGIAQWNFRRFPEELATQTAELIPKAFAAAQLTWPEL